MNEPHPPPHAGSYLRDARHKAGLRQADVAAEAGIDVSYLSKIEHGHMTASIATLERLAEIVDLDPLFITMPALKQRLRQTAAGRALLDALPPAVPV